MRSILFDLDGTLIDSAPDIHAAVNRLLAGEGRAPVTAATSRGFIGNGAAVLVRRLMADSGLPDDDRLHARLLARFLADYESAVHLTRPYPHVPETLEALDGAGWRIGLCTNKPLAPTRAVLRHLGLERFFAAIIAGDSLDRRKPDPAPLQAAVQAAGGFPAVFVGDSEVDAECADAAGLPFLLFTEGYRKAPVEALPHRGAFADFRDLPGLAQRLIAV